MASVAPRKGLSQNFLTDPRTARRIVDLLEPAPGDVVLEIGPGTGALTRHLVDSSVAHIDAFDIDSRVVSPLQELVDRSQNRLEVHIVNVLSVSLQQHFAKTAANHRKVVGNIPYSITSEILFWLFDNANHVDTAVIMMQKEVARRCVGLPGTKDYGIISVAAWYASEASLKIDRKSVV